MKLYTKEMFLTAAEKCEVSMIDAKHIMQYIDEYVTPIELPSDEEMNVKIQKAIDKFEEAKTNSSSFRDIIYLDGVLAVLDTIKNETFNQTNQ